MAGMSKLCPQKPHICGFCLHHVHTPRNTSSLGVHGTKETSEVDNLIVSNSRLYNVNNMQQEEQIAAQHLQQNIIASAIIAIGFISAAAVLAYLPRTSSAHAQAVDARTLVNNPVYINADGKC